MDMFDFLYFFTNEKRFKSILSSLSQYDYEFISNFCNVHSDLCICDLVQSLCDVYPEFYDKLKLIIKEV